MNTSHIRLLYLPNEGKRNGRQTEGRVAFESMFAAGDLQAYEVFSFWDALESGLTPAAVHEKLYQLACVFQPHILLWQHPTDFPVCTDTIHRIKALNPSPLIVYDERDAYVWPQKRLMIGSKSLCSQCDVAFVTGLNTGKLFNKQGVKRVFYSPHGINARQFDKPWDPAVKRKYDVVIIANINRYKYPVIRLPGTKERWVLAEKLYKIFGQRLAVYGNGWPARPYYKGVLDFDRQVDAIREGWTTAIWDRCPKDPLYFSDRLGISMISGVPHVTNYHPGFEFMFDNGVELFYANTVNGVVDAIQYVLSLSVDDRIAIGRRGAEYARKHLDSTIVFNRLIHRCIEELELRRMS